MPINDHGRAFHFLKSSSASLCKILMFLLNIFSWLNRFISKCFMYLFSNGEWDFPLISFLVCLLLIFRENAHFCILPFCWNCLSIVEVLWKESLESFMYRTHYVQIRRLWLLPFIFVSLLSPSLGSTFALEECRE